MQTCSLLQNFEAILHSLTAGQRTTRDRTAGSFIYFAQTSLVLDL